MEWMEWVDWTDNISLKCCDGFILKLSLAAAAPLDQKFLTHGDGQSVVVVVVGQQQQQQEYLIRCQQRNSDTENMYSVSLIFISGHSAPAVHPTMPATNWWFDCQY